MASLETLALFSSVLGIAYFCGYGVVTLLLPEEYLQEFGFIIMPPVGYCVFSWIVFNASGSLKISGEKAVSISLLITGVLAVGAFCTRKPRQPILKGILSAIPLSACISFFVLWPLFYVGSDTFLGAVNPDYTATFLDLHHLKEHSLTEEKVRQNNSHSYFATVTGTVSKSARFASCYFVLLVQTLLPITMRSALTLSIGLFLFCLPLSVYFMARVAFGFNRTAALMASGFIGISGPIAMSYVYFYVGQNSGLGVLPVVLACLYLLVTKPSWKVLVLSTLLLNGLYAMYAAMVPYAVAPVGLVALYLVAKRELNFPKAAGIALGIIMTTVLLNLGNLRFLAAALLGWSKIVSLSLQGQYFIDFLTERFFPIFFGLVSYPVGSSFLALAAGYHLVYVMPVLVALVVIALLLAGIHWVRNTKDSPVLVLGLAIATIYGIVWYVYTFHRQYGYAVFKMSSWLQFVYVLPLAYGLDIALRNLKSGATHKRRLMRGLLACLLVIIVTNLMSTYQLTKYSLGKDPVRGFIVNSYDMSGNYDYLSLASDIGKLVPRDKSVGMSFIDSIQHEWISYYLRDFKVSWLGHYLIPGDDENLPDIVTRRVADYYGNVGIDRNFYFNGATDDYYLTWNEAHMNKEILAQRLPSPLWQNHTFRLFKTSECPDFLFLGRGWYRLEFPIKDLSFWLPERLRWSAEGGEVYMLRASRPNEPYRLSFVGIVGHGLNSSKRTVELWHNLKKFDEFQIDVAARIISAPFFPTGGVDRLVIKVKESVTPIARRFRLWNRDVPGDYRRLNLLASEIGILPPESRTSDGDSVHQLEGHLLFSRSAYFNGLHLDRWISETALLAYPRPSDSSELHLGLFIPGHRDLPLPTRIHVFVDGTENILTVTNSGPLSLTVPLRQGENRSTTEITIQPERSFVPEGSDLDDRPVRISARLESVVFK